MCDGTEAFPEDRRLFPPADDELRPDILLNSSLIINRNSASGM